MLCDPAHARNRGNPDLIGLTDLIGNDTSLSTKAKMLGFALSSPAVGGRVHINEKTARGGATFNGVARGVREAILNTRKVSASVRFGKPSSGLRDIKRRQQC